MRRRACRRALAATPAVAIAAVLVLAGPAAGQAVLPSVGAAVGVSTLPRYLAPHCAGSPAGRVGAVHADLRGAVPLTRTLGLEARLGGEGPVPQSCAAFVFVPPDGIDTLREFRSADDGTISTDLRLRWQPTSGVVLATGVGWLWTLRAPYLAVAPEIRTPGRVRMILGGDVLVGRFSYDIDTAEWRSGEVVREISRVGHHDWRWGAGVRLGIEVGLR